MSQLLFTSRDIIWPGREFFGQLFLQTFVLIAFWYLIPVHIKESLAIVLSIILIFGWNKSKLFGPWKCKDTRGPLRDDAVWPSTSSDFFGFSALSHFLGMLVYTGEFS